MRSYLYNSSPLAFNSYKKKLTSLGKNIKKLEVSFIAARNVKLVWPFWNRIWQFLQNVKRRITTWLNNSSLKYISKRNENKCSCKDVHTNIHSSVIHKSQKVEIAQMSIKWWMNKQNVFYPYNEILFSHTKWWSTDTL